MAAHVVIVGAFYCAVIAPVVDKAAGVFPQLLPLQIANTLSDVACVAILHAPTAQNILGIIGDVASVIGDLAPHKIGGPRHVFECPISHGRR